MTVRHHGASRSRSRSNSLSRQAALASMLACVTAAAMAPGAAQSQDTIKIGVPVPLSGSYASAGSDILNGAKLAADRINKAGGLLGKQIELLPVDDACDADKAAQAAQKLVDAGVVAVAGGYCSSASVPEARVFNGAGIPFVLDASTNPQLTEQGWSNVFRTIGRDDEQGPFAAKFIKDSLHAKRVAVINDSTTYSKGLADNTVAALKKEGVDVVYDDPITPGEEDYTSTLNQISKLPSATGASSPPDVIYYTGYFAEAGILVKEARQLGLKREKVTFMGGDGTTDPTLLQAAGAAANGMIITTAPLPEFLPAARGFVDDYRKVYGHAPGPYSVYEYDAIGVTAKAIDDAKSAKPADIIAALHKVSNYKGMTGEIGFDSKGDRTNASFITIIVEDKVFKPYKRLDASGRWVAVK